MKKYNILFIGCFSYLVICLYLKTDAAYMKCLYVMIFAIVVAKLHLMLLKSKLVVSLEEADQAIIHKKESTDFIIKIENPTFLESPYICIELKATYHAMSKEIKTIYLTVPPHGKKEICIAYEGKLSGMDTLEVEKVVLQDFFQIVHSKLVVYLKKKVIVLPEVRDIHFNHLLRQMRAKIPGEQMVQMMTDNGEVCSELVPYKEGDSLRLINWKIVARRDLYVVRQREESVSVKKEFIIVVDPICKEMNEIKRAHIIDKALVACMSCINELVKEEKVTLVYLKEGNWQTITIASTVSIEEVAKILGAYGIVDLEKQSAIKERWPIDYFKQIGKTSCSKLMITTGLTQELVDEMEEEKNANLLEMSRSPFEDEVPCQVWYLSDEFEVTRNV